MRTLGIDAAISKSGYALTVDGIPQLCGMWKPPSKLKLQSDKLVAWGSFVRAIVLYTTPDLVVIEECGPQRNAKVFRALVRAECVAAYESRLAGKDVLLVMVKAVREVAMGDGKMGKETVFAKLSEQYSQFEWLPFDKGGNDMSDALAMSLAGEKLMDRR